MLPLGRCPGLYKKPIAWTIEGKPAKDSTPPCPMTLASGPASNFLPWVPNMTSLCDGLWLVSPNPKLLLVSVLFTAKESKLGQTLTRSSPQRKKTLTQKSRTQQILYKRKKCRSQGSAQCLPVTTCWASVWIQALPSSYLAEIWLCFWSTGACQLFLILSLFSPSPGTSDSGEGVRSLLQSLVGRVTLCKRTELFLWLSSHIEELGPWGWAWVAMPSLPIP